MVTKKASSRKGKAREIALQVPKDVNLVEMSAEEIEKLALDMARKTASSLPPNSALLGIDRVTLTNNASREVGVWGAWSRGCGRPKELARERISVNPEVFRSPITVAGDASTKRVIDSKQAALRDKQTESRSGGKKTSSKKRR
jgi:hypothetical protein